MNGDEPRVYEPWEIFYELIGYTPTDREAPHTTEEANKAIDARYHEFELDRSSCRVPFQTLHLIWQAWLAELERKGASFEPRQPVEVPWWVLSALGMAWDRHEASGAISFDVAAGLMRAGAGHRSEVRKARVVHRNRGIAMDVAAILYKAGKRRNHQLRVDGAIRKATELYGDHIRRATVEAAWKAYGTVAKQKVALHAGQKDRRAFSQP